MDGQHPERTCFQGSPLAAALFSESGDALLVVDPLTERVVDANPMALRLSEFSREELLRASIRSLVRHEQEWQDWMAPVQQTATFHGKDGFLLRTRPSDRWVPVSITISRLHVEDGDPVALFALRDRREQVEAHRRLQRTEAELRRMLVSVSDCLWSCRIEPDGKWRYRYLSPVVQRLTGRSVGLFLEDPQAWQQGVDPEDLPRWRAFMQRLTAGYSGELEYRLRRLDGSCVWVRENVVAAPDEGGLLLHGVVADVSERKRSEQQREQHQHAQLQKLESLASMAGVLAHDFNNLITGILGHVSLTRLMVAPDNPALPGLAQVELITLRAAELCKHLAIVAGKTLIGGGAHDLNALARDAAEQMQRILPERVRLRLVLSDALPPAPGDNGQLRQVIANLLNNAFEAVEADGGEMVLRTQLLAPGTSVRTEGEAPCFDYQSSGLAAAPAAVCLEVHNDGPGLSPEVQAHMFDPFFTTKPGGRGLGLSIVLGVVRSHGGGLQVLSPPGRGTTVRVMLPAQPLALAAPVPAASSATAPAGWRGAARSCWPTTRIRCWMWRRGCCPRSAVRCSRRGTARSPCNCSASTPPSSAWPWWT